MTIRRTLWALPAASAIIFAASLSVGAWFTTQTKAGIEATGSIDFPILENTTALITELDAVAASFKSAIIEGERERLDESEKIAASVRNRIATIESLPHTKELAAQLAAGFEAYYQPAKASTEWMMGIASSDQREAVDKAKQNFASFSQVLVDANKEARAKFAEGITRSETNVQTVLNLTVLSAIIVVIALVIIAQLVIRSVWSKLGGEPEYAQEIANAVASGDLSMNIKLEGNDSSSLLAALHRMQQTLQEMIGSIQQSGNLIKTASAEIATGNADLSARTEAQASSIEEVASAMDEMLSTVKNNAANAQEASNMSLTASDVAQRGGEAVDQVVATMDDINKSAKKIADIIGVIDGIAFQTNILALNAAVEAARAGEQGRGFAVVASEVRNLAQRSASAAKEIKELIQESVSRVAAGTSIVNQAGTTMTDVVRSVKDVAEIVNGITHASSEQHTGIEEINRAIVQMDSTTQQNAAMVEQASAAATSLQEQAASLARSLQVFRLASHHAQHAYTRDQISSNGVHHIENSQERLALSRQG